VLIVLVVTSALFLGAIVLISGRQNQAAFDQSIREVQSEIQQVISDVGNGYYPNMNNFSCTTSGTGPLITTSGSTAQGTNSGCIFIGKALQLAVQGTNPEQYRTYPLAGLQKDSSGNDVATFADALPTVVSADATSRALQNGLTVKSMKANGVDVGAVAFTNSLAPVGGVTTTNSTSQHVDLVAIAGSGLHVTPGTAATQINTALKTATVMPTTVQICFASGSTNQSGLITIGDTNASSSSLAVTLVIKGGLVC